MFKLGPFYDGRAQKIDICKLVQNQEWKLVLNSAINRQIGIEVEKDGNSMTYRLKPVDCGQTKVLLRRFHGGLKPLGSCLQGVIYP